MELHSVPVDPGTSVPVEQQPATQTEYASSIQIESIDQDHY